ncbi:MULTISPECIES: Bro-N domain-containing protein [unclassified Caballeronia]|uniref:BRO-N domain-containing protein n=1 Tax=unclassified Caballeronia TaxID=2646786 RepID=UPI0028561A3B|nr:MULTISPECIES: Bro-N domain-containing protein [unclassified Caballeronia]MDR5777286.1 Bro-N domain-containing protein [Caballeronia sp. LZ002]MDR5852724.1 Bro-N domain-containing protein [Caballeronia sp. LZ003]
MRANTLARPEQTQSLRFQTYCFDVIDHSGQRWLQAQQIADALGYKNRRRAINDLFERNAAEFSDDMTSVVTLRTAGSDEQVRIFSLRGAHLLGTLARTSKAAAFRCWIAKLLECEATGWIAIRHDEAQHLGALLIHLKIAQAAWRKAMPALQALESPLTRHQDAFAHVSFYASTISAILARHAASGAGTSERQPWDRASRKTSEARL